MSALVDRIAAVLQAHCPGTYEEGHCDCGEPTAGDPEWAAHVAQRIAAELQLTEETFYSRSPDVSPRRRWVSEWTEKP